MTRIMRIAILFVLGATLCLSQGFAWGPRAQQSLTIMAIQVVKQDYSNTFRTGGSAGTSFERDVLAGAADGWAVLKDTVPLNNDSEAIQAIGTEIQLLHDVRAYGPTSYFAYRMGVLSALVANVVMPYGFAWTPEDEAIQKRVMADIDKHLDGYGFTANQKNRVFIRDVREYFQNRRQFYVDDKRLIADDYNAHAGYNGLMKVGGPAYFARSVEAIADAWHTVLRPEVDASQIPASKRMLAWYFVSEIEYLLQVKKNMYQADRVYTNFEKVNPDLVAAAEKIGDLYYAYGSEGIPRGVREWRLAHGMGGPERNRIAKKLSGHYLKEGQVLLDHASTPEAKSDDLENALNAFEQALEFDRTSQQAADLIQQTHVAIAQRNERHKMNIDIIAKAETTQEEADKARMGGDAGNAIVTYRKTIGLYEAVDNEFKDLEKTAKEGVRKVRKNITDVINEVLDRASDAIDEGEANKENNRFEEAIASYSKVANIVSVIPEDENPSLTQQKKDVVDLAGKKVEEAKVAKLRYEQSLKEQQQRQQQGGGRPAAPAPAQAPAAPAAPPG